MRKIYNTVYGIIAMLFMIVFVGACSKTEDDISGPQIHVSLPKENDTIHLYQDNIHISMDILGNGNLTELKIELRDYESKTILYADPTYDALNEPKFNCDDPVPQSKLTYKIDKLTKLELYVHAKNDSHAFNTVSRIFYVKP